jgi:hypothetical protein
MGWGKYSPLQSAGCCGESGQRIQLLLVYAIQKKCKITMENIADEDMYLYYQIDYILTDVPDDAAYFHAAVSPAQILCLINRIMCWWMV